MVKCFYFTNCSSAEIFSKQQTQRKVASCSPLRHVALRVILYATEIVALLLISFWRKIKGKDLESFSRLFQFVDCSASLYFNARERKRRPRSEREERWLEGEEAS